MAANANLNNVYVSVYAVYVYIYREREFTFVCADNVYAYIHALVNSHVHILTGLPNSPGGPMNP